MSARDVLALSIGSAVAGPPALAECANNNEVGASSTSPVYGVSPYGWPIKEGIALALPIQAGLQALICGSTHTAICTEWGNKGGRLAQAKINDAQR